MRKLAFLASFAALALAGPASAKLIAFDLLKGSDKPIPEGWAGFHWSDDFFYLDGADYIGTGFDNGVVSSPNVAFNNGVNTVGFGRKKTFELVSFYVTAAWRNNLSFRVSGLLDGAVVDRETFTINTSGPTLITLDWNDINHVVFYAYGGTYAGLGGNGPEFALDNLTTRVVSTIPEPSTWALMLLGFAGLGSAGYYRSKNGRIAARRLNRIG
jgi:PEP-CTERM motif